MGCCNNKFTKEQWLTLGVIGSVHFASAVCVSLQAPFYPEEAESKNATATEYGFVFGIYELVSFICSPLLGNYIDRIGAKLLLNSGVFTAAICIVAFGMLHLVMGRTAFVTLSFIIRIIEAMGSSAAVTSAFAITAATFPENVATVFATLEIFYGLGYIAGPTLGGILYSLGGFILPFAFMGCVLFIVGTAVFFLLPSYQRSNSTARKGTLIDIVKIPAVLLDSASIMGVALCMGYYSATLEPHIRFVKLSPIALGFVFIVHGGTYAVTAPLIGRLCDSFANPKYLILIGCLLTMLSASFVGPLPFFDISPSLPLVIIGLVCLGLALAFVLVSAFTDAIRSAIAHGFPDGISTYGLVSGLWAASFSLGDFIGPSSAGFLDDLVGFRYGTLLIIIVQILIFTSMLFFVIRTRRKNRKEIHVNGELLESQLEPLEKEPLNLVANWTQDEYGSCSRRESMASHSSIKYMDDN